MPGHTPTFAGTILAAARAYADDVVAGTFPGPEETVRMDDAVLDEVLGRGASDRAAGDDAGRRHPARPRPVARPRSRTARLTRIVRTRAELRAALDGVARPVGVVPTMGWLHDGHRALMRQARAADATHGRDDLRQPSPVQRRRGLHQVPAKRGPGPRDLRGRGCRPGLRTGGVGGLPAGLRHGRVGRRGRPAARGRRAAGSLRRRGDGRGHPVRPRRTPITPTSGRRTPSRSWSSARWLATWPSRPR